MSDNERNARALSTEGPLLHTLPWDHLAKSFANCADELQELWALVERCAHIHYGEDPLEVRGYAQALRAKYRRENGS